MRRWRSLGLLGAAALLAGCGGSAEESDAPRLGAPAPEPSPTPAAPMDQLEQPVADQLAPRLQDDGLHLQYVECPPWAGTVPETLSCKAYVDGVVGEVEVRLSDGEGGRVDFDAELGDGLVATRRLVERLEAGGYTAVDCGDSPVYPSRLGMRIVCRAEQAGEPVHLVATVTDRAGGVRIEDY